MDSQKQFDELLSLVKGIDPKTDQNAFCARWLKDIFNTTSETVEKIAPYAFRVMGSRIFHRGGLNALQDGHILTGGKSHYPIGNLPGFVFDLALLFSTLLEEISVDELQKEAEQEWERLLEDFNFISGRIKATKIAKKKEIAEVRTRLEEWQKSEMEKMMRLTCQSYDPIKLKKVTPILQEEALKIFVKHLPGDRMDTIRSKRCADLLKTFGIPTKKETLRKRLTRAKTKAPTK